MDTTRHTLPTDAGASVLYPLYAKKSRHSLRSEADKVYARRIELAGFEDLAEAGGDNRSKGIARASTSVGAPSPAPGIYLQQVWKQTVTTLDFAEPSSAVLAPKDLGSITRIATKMAMEHPIELGDFSQQGLLAEVCRSELPYWDFNHTRLAAVWHLGQMAAFHRVRAQLQKAVYGHHKGIRTVRIQEQATLIARSIRLCFPYTPREHQTEAVRHLVFDQADLILIARTSFGKSTVLQAYSMLLDCVTLVVLPLNRIGKEQEAKIRKVGGNPLAINADRKNNLTAEEKGRLRHGQYTHLMMSPEAAVSPWFRDMLAQPELQDRIGLIVVDEFHLVDQWGKAFRKEYGKLRFLRGCLPAHVPWFACSATLDTLTLIEAQKGAGFHPNTRIMRTPIDRPEIFLRVATIPDNTLHSFDALFHIVEPSWSVGANRFKPQSILKTVVFTESRGGCGAIAEALKAHLNHLSKGRIPCTSLDKLIKVYHGRTGECSQDRIVDSFNSGGEVRIVVATEALGLGVDIESIEHVYQYGFPRYEHIAVLWQRAGRACRGRIASKGCFTLLVPSSVFKSKVQGNNALEQYQNKVLERVKQQDTRTQSGKTSNKTGKQKSPSIKKPASAKQAEAEAKRGEEDEKEIMALNSHVTRRFATTEDCRRRVVLEFLDEVGLAEYCFPNPELCCDNCSKQYLEVRVAIPAGQQVPRYSRVRTEIYMHFLVGWEWTLAQQVFQHSVFPALPGSLFSHSLLEQIARDQSESAFRTITNETLLAAFVARHGTGPRAHRHIRELWHVVYQLEKLAQDKITVEQATRDVYTVMAEVSNPRSNMRSVSPAVSMFTDTSVDTSIASERASPIVSPVLKRRRIEIPQSSQVETGRTKRPTAVAGRQPLIERSSNVVVVPPTSAKSPPSTPSASAKPLLVATPNSAPQSPYTVSRSGRSAMRSQIWLERNR